MNHAMWRTVIAAFRHAALPLASYYAVTLALPLANGAADRGAAFLEHAVVVLVVPPVLIVCAVSALCAVRSAFQTCRRPPVAQASRRL